MAGGRRTSLASMAGQKVETVPGQSDPILVRLALAKVVPTPLNPRTNFGSDEELAELGESMRKRQLQPVVVVGRTSYLRLFPEHTEQVGTASHVIANGERRYRAARHAGLDGLNALILEEVAAAREDFLDAVLSENIDRKNFDPIEEAHAVLAMVKECGKAVVAAERFRRTAGWVSQRLSLLKLTPEVQGLVRSGKIPVREARELAAKPPEEQMLLWRRTAQQKQDQAEQRRATKATALPVAVDPAPAPEVVQPPGTAPARALHAVPTPATPAPAPTPPAAGPRPVPAPGTVPDAHEEPPAEARPAPVLTVPHQHTEEQQSAANLPPAPGEPDWAGDPAMAEIVDVGRYLVDTMTPDRRRRLGEYLLAVSDAGDHRAQEAAQARG